MLTLIVWFRIARDVTAATLLTPSIVPVGLLDNILKPIVWDAGPARRLR